MKSVTHNGREFLFVEVPEDATGFEIKEVKTCIGKFLNYHVMPAHRDDKGKRTKWFNPDSNEYLNLEGYRILCKASEAGEDLKAEILSLGMEVNRVIILEKIK